MNDDALILETLISAKADILHNVNSRKMTADLMALEARKVNALNVLLESGAQLDLGELLMFGAAFVQTLEVALQLQCTGRIEILLIHRGRLAHLVLMNQVPLLSPADLHALGHIDSDQISEIAEADPEECAFRGRCASQMRAGSQHQVF